ncbi:unnamed protein product [Prunus armeniaca]
MKGQAIADFVSEFTPSILSTEHQSWTLHVNGASNRHGSGAGIVLSAPGGTEVEYALRFQFKTTNNEAEYEALLAGLRLAQDLGAQGLRAHSDSLLVVNQINNTYQARSKRMGQYVKEAQRLASQFAHFAISQVPRSQNSRADALAKLASALDGGIKRSIPIEYLANPTISETPTETMAIGNNDNWRHPSTHTSLAGPCPPILTRHAAYSSNPADTPSSTHSSTNVDGHEILREVHEGVCGCNTPTPNLFLF